MATPTDTYELLQFNMIRAHDTFKLGYEKIVTLLADPPQNDIKNFLGYCEAWALSVVDHHDSEELVVFPFLNQKMDFSREEEQHKVIHDTLEKLLAIIQSAKEKPAQFKPDEMRELMVNFKEPLVVHLDEEVEHISADKLREAQFQESEIKTMISQLEAHAKSSGNPFLQVPYMRSHTPPEYKDSWPPMPWFLRKVMIPYMLAKRLFWHD
ncbi:hypothetical protein PHLCEN_2v5691 [Hermanssonia centrifuga]|uniref:Hemerythrin-like domain-containing protein n=1 Tax=Hermanssonia centrifuga TaxID=98765 RepID=A0A2R6P1L3_9APHY|nr:hypothetical protein PHLCEN_2v5691 [Hermanssonia centrifuga]